jgi:hypothetical protein
VPRATQAARPDLSHAPRFPQCSGWTRSPAGFGRGIGQRALDWGVCEGSVSVRWSGVGNMLRREKADEGIGDGDMCKREMGKERPLDPSSRRTRACVAPALPSFAEALTPSSSLAIALVLVPITTWTSSRHGPLSSCQTEDSISTSFPSFQLENTGSWTKSAFREFPCNDDTFRR